MPFSTQEEYKLKYQFHAEQYGQVLGIEQTLIPLTKHELVCMQLQAYHLLPALALKVELALNNREMFFKLSSRSGKDLGVTPVGSFHDIVKQVCQSARLKEDIELHLDDNSENKLYIVLKEWVPDIKHEYRCFVVNNSVVAYCDCNKEAACPKPLGWDANTCLQKLAAAGYSTYCIDLYNTHSDGTIRVCEINQLDMFTDTIDFTYHELLLMDCLSRCRCDAKKVLFG